MCFKLFNNKFIKTDIKFGYKNIWGAAQVILLCETNCWVHGGLEWRDAVFGLVDQVSASVGEFLRAVL